MNNTNFICYEDVLYILEHNYDLTDVILPAVKKLPLYPDPGGSRNMSGQTQEEFWELVDNRDRAGRW